MNTKRLFLLLGYLSLSSFLNAAISYGGDGCPVGTANVVVNDDGSFRLVLDSFDLTANQQITSRKSCNIAIPLDVPPGYSANFGQVSIQGLYDIKSNTTVSVDSEAFLAGGAGPIYSRAFNGEGAGPISLVFTPSPAWSPCGTSPILRLNTAVVLKVNKAGQGTSGAKIMEIGIGKPMLKRCN